MVRYAPLHRGSDRAVKILEAARQQGKYWEVVEKALETQPQWAAHDSPNPELIWELIANTGLDVAKAKAAADSPEIDQLLKQDVADMKALKVERTPSFFVNGTPLLDFGVAQLKALWGAGYSGCETARELGNVTREAVIGKLHRLGLIGERLRALGRPRQALAADCLREARTRRADHPRPRRLPGRCARSVECPPAYQVPV